jgi:hypothetical protein
MFIYWFLFLIPLYFILVKVRGGVNTSQLEWRLFGFFLIILIGLRYRVGGDWFTYLEGLELEKNIQWKDLLLKRDPGFTLVSWFSLALGASVYGINLICAAIFTGGLISLSRIQPYPWLSVLVAIPYLVIVVAMGYTRQAAALGFLMYGFGYLVRGRLAVYLLLVLLAGMLHKTAFIFVALMLFRPGSGKLKNILGVGLLMGLVGVAYLVEQVDTFVLNYVENTMESAGGQIRTLMNLPPALILITYWKKWGQKFDDRWLWGVISLLAIVCVPLVSIASTAVDRMALYLIPLQLVVWSRFPVLVQGSIERSFAFFIVVSIYAIVQYTWLVYGNHAFLWIPYDNLLFPSF